MSKATQIPDTNWYRQDGQTFRTGLNRNGRVWARMNDSTCIADGDTVQDAIDDCFRKWNAGECKTWAENNQDRRAALDGTGKR